MDGTRNLKSSGGHCLHHRKSCAGRDVLLEPKAGPLQQRAIFIKTALAARQYHHHEEVKNGAGSWLPDLAQEHLDHDDAASCQIALVDLLPDENAPVPYVFAERFG